MCEVSFSLTLPLCLLCRYLGTPREERNPREKFGALVMLEALHEVLITSKVYSKEVENIITLHILPECSSPHSFLRARVIIPTLFTLLLTLLTLLLTLLTLLTSLDSLHSVHSSHFLDILIDRHVLHSVNSGKWIIKILKYSSPV